MKRESNSGNQGERGAILFLVAAMMTVILGIAALAIDLGVWYVARSEAQRAAEAGAHAGASLLMISPGDDVAARAEAETFAEENTVRGLVPDVLPDDDIDVILDSQKVRVRVQRSGGRGNPVATLFAKVMGINTVDINAVAAAQAWPGVATDCILPFAIPDRWMEWDPDLLPAPGAHRPSDFGDIYDGPTVDSTDPPGPQEDYYAEAVTGYASQHVGETIQLTTANPGEAPQPGWFYPIALTGSSGSSDFRDSIINCWEPGGDNELGDEVDKEPGNIVGPTRQGFRDIFNDPDEQNQRWDDDLNWPVHADGSPVSVSSRRIRPIPMFDPRTWPDIDQGRKPVEVMNLAGIWMEDFDGNNVVTARWLHYTAVKAAEGEWDGSSGALLKILRIVQ